MDLLYSINQQIVALSVCSPKIWILKCLQKKSERRKVPKSIVSGKESVQIQRTIQEAVLEGYDPPLASDNPVGNEVLDGMLIGNIEFGSSTHRDATPSDIRGQRSYLNLG